MRGLPKRESLIAASTVYCVLIATFYVGGHGRMERRKPMPMPKNSERPRKRRSQRPDWLKSRSVKDKDGKERTAYVYDAWMEDESGRFTRERKSLGFDYEAAIRKGERFREEVQKGRIEKTTKAKSMTIGEFAKQWFSHRVPQTRKHEDAVEDAKQRFRDHIEPYLGDTLIDELTREHIDEMRFQLRNKRNGKPLAPGTERQVLLDLSGLIEYAVVCKKLDRSRLSEVERIAPKVKQKAPKPISEEDQALIFGDPELPPDERFHIKLARWTGWRQRNLHEIRWGDVQLDVDKPYAVLTESKNGEAYKLPLTEQAISLLRERRKEMGNRIPHQDEPVSPFRERQADSIYQASSRRISKRLKRAFRWNIHRLRDTFACWLVDSDMPLEDVQALLGHKSITMTEKYARRSFRRTAETLRKVTGQVDGQSKPSKVVDLNRDRVIA